MPFLAFSIFNNLCITILKIDNIFVIIVTNTMACHCSNGKRKLSDTNIVYDSLENDKSIDYISGKEVTIRYQSGNIYKGEYENNQKNGKGTMIYPDGRKYIGEYKNDKRHGQGIFTFRNGSYYDGQWDCGKNHGKGIFKWRSGKTYIGDFENTRINGKGIMKYPDGSIYEGDFKNEDRHGNGLIISKYDGYSYEGEWTNDRKNGNGIIRYGSDKSTCYNAVFAGNILISIKIL